MALLTCAVRLWAVGLLAQAVAALAADISRENQIKAAFVYNFPQFVDWPASAFAAADAPLVIGVVGDDPFDGFLDNLVRNTSVNTHPLQVRRFTRWQDAAGCQLVFVSVAQPDRMRAILAGLAGKPVLTVGDSPHFLADGGMIRFVDENNKMRLRIDLVAARRANLAISSKLLRRAEIAAPGTD